MRQTFLAVLLALLLAPGAAWAQPGAEQRIQAALRQASTVGVPLSLLESKVAEGRAKGVPADRIAGAVERRLELLTEARRAMGPRVAPGDLSAGADALDAGVPPQVLASVAGRAPADRRAMAIVVLTQLVQGGLASERALERVSRALADPDPGAFGRLTGEAASAAARERRGPPAGRGPAAEPGARGQGHGRGQGGPPASVPGPRKKPGRGGGNGNRP